MPVGCWLARLHDEDDDEKKTSDHINIDTSTNAISNAPLVYWNCSNANVIVFISNFAANERANIVPPAIWVLPEKKIWVSGNCRELLTAFIVSIHQVKMAAYPRHVIIVSQIGNAVGHAVLENSSSFSGRQRYLTTVFPTIHYIIHTHWMTSVDGMRNTKLKTFKLQM